MGYGSSSLLLLPLLGLNTDNAPVLAALLRISFIDPSEPIKLLDGM
jgi:hypothetical protein